MSLDYLIKCEFSYQKKTDDNKEIKCQETKVFQVDVNGARMPEYTLLNYVLPGYLKSTVGAQDTAWSKLLFRIIKIVNRTNPNDIADIPLRRLSLDQLEAYCARFDLVVPLKEFHNTEEARYAVKLAKEDPKGYQTYLRDYRSAANRAYPEMDKYRQGTDVKDYSDEFDKLESNAAATAPQSTKKKTAKTKPVEVSADEEAALSTPEDTNPLNSL